MCGFADVHSESVGIISDIQTLDPAWEAQRAWEWNQARHKRICSAIVVQAVRPKLVKPWGVCVPKFSDVQRLGRCRILGTKAGIEIQNANKHIDTRAGGGDKCPMHALQSANCDPPRMALHAR